LDFFVFMILTESSSKGLNRINKYSLKMKICFIRLQKLWWCFWKSWQWELQYFENFKRLFVISSEFLNYNQILRSALKTLGQNVFIRTCSNHLWIKKGFQSICRHPRSHYHGPNPANYQPCKPLLVQITPHVHKRSHLSNGVFLELFLQFELEGRNLID
jgi:hypothetical protein